MVIPVKSPLLSACTLSLALLLTVSAEVFFEERFTDGWEKRWIKSKWKKDEKMAGKWNHTAGKWNGDPEDKGIQTNKDYRYYAISAEFPQFSNKDKTLVFQYSVKREQKHGCAGAYMKLIGGSIDQNNFGGETPYSIMFGPDICGQYTKKIHAILSKNGKVHMMRNEIPWETDQLTHVYTFIIRPDNTYSILVDNIEKKSGSLFEDWDILPPKKIEDPEAKKPEDWDDREYIPAPEAENAEDSDDTTNEKPDSDDTSDEKPDLDDTSDEISDPDDKKKIKNPNYMGKWSPPLNDNPDYYEDPDLYVFSDLRFVGIDLWQVKSGTLFDNILVCDDPSYAKKLAEETWGKLKDAEKEAFEVAEKRREEKEDKYSVLKQDENDEENYEDDDDITLGLKKEKSHDEL